LIENGVLRGFYGTRTCPGFVQGAPRPPRGRRGRGVVFGRLMVNTLGRRQNEGGLGEVVRNRGWKSPRSGGQASGVQNESDEWKSLTNCPRPRVAWRQEARWTCGSTGSNDR